MKFRTNEKGSITLEAALVLPLFLAFVLCLITIIRLTIVQMSLQNATSEMTKQVATHVYPVSLAYDTFQDSALGKAIRETYKLATSSEARMDKANDLIDQQVDKIITDPITDGLKQTMEEEGIDSSISEMVANFVKDNLLSAASDELKQTVKEQALDPVQDANESLDAYTQRVEEQVKSRLTQAFNNAIRPFVLNFMDATWVDKDRLQVTELTLPNFAADNPKFGIEVEYTYKLVVPFISYDLKLRTRSVERVWSGS